MEGEKLRNEGKPLLLSFHGSAVERTPHGSAVLAKNQPATLNPQLSTLNLSSSITFPARRAPTGSSFSGCSSSDTALS